LIVDETNQRMKVAVETLPSLPAGTNNIGDGDVLSLPVQGNVTQTHSGQTAGSEVEVDVTGYNTLIIWHVVSGAPVTGGYVSLNLKTASGGTSLTHPAPAGNSEWGLNVQTADTTSSYVEVFKGVSKIVGVNLNVTDGTHDVYVMPINL